MAVYLCFFFFFFFLLFSSVNAANCNQCVQAKATFFRNSEALSYGACGYGPIALNLYAGHIAAAVPSIYKDGEGCGSCFQIRCNKSGVCKGTGTTFVVTDSQTDDQNSTTDFVLSNRAFRAMALPGMDKQLLHLGVADVEYKRVPCVYKHENLGIRVEEFSKPPNYLAIKVLYQGGQTSILGVDVSGDDGSVWGLLSRKYGAVWETDSAPTGNLTFRFIIRSGFNAQYLYTNEGVLPANWKVGVIYNSTVQITDVALDVCGRKPWN